DLMELSLGSRVDRPPEERFVEPLRGNRVVDGQVDEDERVHCVFLSVGHPRDGPPGLYEPLSRHSTTSLPHGSRKPACRPSNSCQCTSSHNFVAPFSIARRRYSGGSSTIT